MTSTFPASPRKRRLESDFRRLEQLAAESSIFSFQVVHPKPTVGPPETYRIRFRGMGLQFVPHLTSGTVTPLHDHEILIQLVAEYPRSAPHMRWMTPIYHPNISASGAICLGGWGTHWAPSLQLDRLCEMLWDMMRFANYDTRSPFNQQAASWLRSQRQYRFPLDRRELRDQPQIFQAVAVTGAPPAKAPAYPASSNGNSDALIRFDQTVQVAPEFNRHNPDGTSSNKSSPTDSQPSNSPPDILFLD